MTPDQVVKTGRMCCGVVGGERKIEREREREGLIVCGGMKMIRKEKREKERKKEGEQQSEFICLSCVGRR